MTEQTNTTTAETTTASTSSSGGLSVLDVIKEDFDWIKQHALSEAHTLLVDIHKLNNVGSTLDLAAEAEKIVVIAKKFEAYLKEKL